MSFVNDYYTGKQVVITDPFLGKTYYAFCFFILWYTIINNVFINKGYLEFENRAIGAMRMRLREPENLTDDMKYCEDVKDGCRKFDSYDVVYPPGQDETLFVTTYAEDVYERKLDSDWEETHREQYFVSQPEHFFIRLHHNFLATTFYEDSQSEEEANQYAKSNEEMEGSLYKGWRSNATKIETFPKFTHTDNIYISSLLEASEISLSEKSKVIEHLEEPIRSRGCVLYVSITYTNVGSVGTTEPFYKIRTIRVPGADYKINQVIPITSTERIIRKRYGIQFKFFQRVKIAKFSFAALLYHIISGIGLLQIATIIVDLIATYIVSHSIHYTNVKYARKEIQEIDGQKVVQKKPFLEHKKKDNQKRQQQLTGSEKKNQ